jgi:ATP-dependent Zn protease
MKMRISSVAYHEAGHAVVAALLGMHVAAVSMQAKGFPPVWHLRGGVIASFDHIAWQNRDKAEKAATAGLAGEQAERLWCRQKPWRHAKSSRHAGFSGDRAYVEEMLRPVIKGSKDKQRTIKRLKEEARALLASHWSYVETVAAKLAERKVLSGTDVKRLALWKQ